MLLQPSSESGARVRGGSFVSPRNPELEKFQTASSALKEQQKLERIAIAAMLSLSVGAITAPILFGKSIPLPVRTAMLLFGAIASAATWSSASIMQKKEPIYAALDKAQKHAVNLEFETGVAGMETLARVKGAIATHQNILRLVPEQYQAFALKQANLSDVRQVEALPVSMPMNLPMPPSMAEVQSSYEQAIAVSPTQSSKTLPTNAAELMERLFNECPEFLKLVEAPPIRLVGVQRTGKSTFARKLALLRAIVIPGHKVAWSTPHLESDNPLPKELNYFGFTENGKDFNTIESAWKAVQVKGLDQGKQLNLTAVWDEFGGYDAFYDAGLLGDSLKALLREASKHSYYPILIAHGDAVNFYPGVKDILKVLQGGTVLVETIGKPTGALGRMRPTGEVKITWLDGNQQQIKIPDWLTEELLLSLQPADTKSEIVENAIARNTFTDPYAAQRSPGSIPSKPTSKPITVNDTDWYEAIKQWLYTEPSLPTDEAIKAKWHELTGNILNDGGLALLKQNLNLP